MTHNAGREIQSDWVLEKSGNTTCFGGVEEQPTMKVQDYKGVSSMAKGTRNSVEKVRMVATEHGLRSGKSSTGETCQEVKPEIKMEAAGEAGQSRKLSNDKERDEGTRRHDSYEDDSVVVGNSKQDDPGKETDVKMTRSHLHQPLLLHRAPR